MPVFETVNVCQFCAVCRVPAHTKGAVGAAVEASPAKRRSRPAFSNHLISKTVIEYGGNRKLIPAVYGSGPVGAGIVLYGVTGLLTPL